MQTCGPSPAQAAERPWPAEMAGFGAAGWRALLRRPDRAGDGGDHERAERRSQHCPRAP